MELWIRSQDKRDLKKNNDIFEIRFIRNNICYGDGWAIFIDKAIMGVYETKERALEVLDEIQNILQPKPLVIVRPSEEMVELLGGRQVGKTMKMKQDFEFKELSTYVYQMPEN